MIDCFFNTYTHFKFVCFSSIASETWKDRALQTLKYYYIQFSGTQWHEFNIKTDLDLLTVKICFAVYGLPENTYGSSAIKEANDDCFILLEDAYNDKQKKRAKEIIDNILRVKRNEASVLINIGFAFVICCQINDKKEFPVPVFSVLVGTEKDRDIRNFVDTQGRTYKTWDNWKKTNCLPKAEIAYPKHGYFTCDEDGWYDFDINADPVIEFGKSPNCSALSTAKTVGDYVGTATSLGNKANQRLV